MNLACLALIIHMTSWHFGGAYNEDNRGVGVSCDGYHVGTFRNSLDRQSAYLGRSWERCRGPVCAGAGVVAVTGYRSGPVVAPLPLISIGNGTRVALTAMPSVGGMSGFVGLAMEVRPWEGR